MLRASLARAIFILTSVFKTISRGNENEELLFNVHGDYLFKL